MNAVLTGNFVHRLLLLQGLQGHSPLGPRDVSFAFYRHRFSPCGVDIFILVSGPKYGEYHSCLNVIVVSGLVVSCLRRSNKQDDQLY